MAEAIETHKRNLFVPISERGRRRVVVAFAATASQWCSDNRSLMTDQLPTPQADAALQVELQQAFGPTVTVVAQTFAEINASSVRPAVQDEYAYYRRNTSDFNISMQSAVNQISSWHAQIIGMARAREVWWRAMADGRLPPANGTVTFLKARLDVQYQYELTVPYVFRPSAVYMLPSRPDTGDVEHCFPVWSDFTFVFSGDRCLDALQRAAKVDHLQHDPDFARGCPLLFAENQFVLQLEAADCAVASLGEPEWTFPRSDAFRTCELPTASQ
jgi:hypothetical protein